MKLLHPVNVTKDNFKEMGQVITIPNPLETTAQLNGKGFKHFAELAFFEGHGQIEFGITMFDQRTMEVDSLEQHAGTPELLLALDGPFVMPVAPMIIKEGVQLPDETKLFAVRVEQGQGVIFKQGFWHWAPFPITYQSSVLVGFLPKTWEHDIVIKKLKEPVRIVL